MNGARAPDLFMSLRFPCKITFEHGGHSLAWRQLLWEIHLGSYGRKNDFDISFRLTLRNKLPEKLAARSQHKYEACLCCLSFFLGV